MNGLPTQYVALRALTQSLFSLVAKLQPSLLSKAKFISLSLLKPRPPAAFGQQTRDQEIGMRFLSDLPLS